jgi:transcriptional regulator with XRE-family HTH domain
VSKWERGEVPVPAQLRERVRELLTAAPTAPRVSGAELRRFRRSRGLTSQALAETLGVPRSTVVEWQQRGVSRERAAMVREAIDRASVPAQGSLFA